MAKNGTGRYIKGYTTWEGVQEVSANSGWFVYGGYIHPNIKWVKVMGTFTVNIFSAPFPFLKQIIDPQNVWTTNHWSWFKQAWTYVPRPEPQTEPTPQKREPNLTEPEPEP